MIGVVIVNTAFLDRVNVCSITTAIKFVIEQIDPRFFANDLDGKNWHSAFYRCIQKGLEKLPLISHLVITTTSLHINWEKLSDSLANFSTYGNHTSLLRTLINSNSLEFSLLTGRALTDFTAMKNDLCHDEWQRFCAKNPIVCINDPQHSVLRHREWLHDAHFIFHTIDHNSMNNKILIEATSGL